MTFSVTLSLPAPTTNPHFLLKIAQVNTVLHSGHCSTNILVLEKHSSFVQDCMAYIVSLFIVATAAAAERISIADNYLLGSPHDPLLRTVQKFW